MKIPLIYYLMNRKPNGYIITKNKNSGHTWRKRNKFRTLLLLFFLSVVSFDAKLRTF